MFTLFQDVVDDMGEIAPMLKHFGYDPTGMLIDCFYLLFYWFIDLWVGWLTGLIDWRDWLTDGLIDWRTDCPIKWLADWLIDWLIANIYVV